MKDPELSVLIRELKIGSEAARKLSVALSIAWAELTVARRDASKSSSERAVRRLRTKDQDGPTPLGLTLRDVINEEPFE